MKINKKIVMIIAIIASLSWLGNIYLFKSNRFDEFVFLNHYMDVEITNKLLSYDEEYVRYFNSLPEYAQRNAAYTEISFITLFYIKDCYNSEQIQAVKFPEISDEYIAVNESTWSSGNNRPTIMRIDINFDNLPYEEKYDLVKQIKSGDVSIGRMIFETSKQNKYEVNIGELHFDYEENYLTEDTDNNVIDEAVDIKLNFREAYFEDLINENYEFYTYEDGVRESIVNIPYSTDGRYVFDIDSRVIGDNEKYNNNVININVEFKGETSLGTEYNKKIRLYNCNEVVQSQNINSLIRKGNNSSEFSGE
ncbi:MAG: hypothetical protein RR620_02185 [Clostridium sp.]